MAFDDTPTTWIAGIAENGTILSFPLTSFPELTAAEANGTTGDIRKIVWALMEKMYQEYNDAATADRPTNWTVTKSATVNATTGVVTNIFTNTIYTEVLTQEVVDES